MMITQIVFSPTGGTERVADTITARWGAPVRKIDLTDPAVDFAAEALDAEALTLIAVPSYGGRVPAPAAERIAKLRGNQARCVVLTVYGNRAYEDTLLELSDLAAGSGFRVIAAAAAVAEHSILHQYAAGRPDPQDEEQLRGFAGRILEKLRSGAEDAPAIPGNRPYRKAGGACSQGHKGLHRLRALRRKVPDRSNQQTGPEKDRRQSLHILYALCVPVPPWSTEGQRPDDLHRRNGHQKSLRREKEQRTVSLMYATKNSPVPKRRES